MGEDSDFFAGFEGIEKFDFGPPIKAEELFADVFFPQLLADFSELVHKLVKVSKQSTRSKINKLLKQVTKARHVDKLLTLYLQNFHRNEAGARIAGLSVKDKKFISFLLLRALVVSVENIRELYDWREVFISGNTELYEEVKQTTPGLVNWYWIHEIFYELDAKDKQILFDLIDNRPATLLVFIVNHFKLKTVDAAFVASQTEERGISVPKQFVENYVRYLENIEEDYNECKADYTVEKFDLIVRKIQSFKGELRSLDIIDCFRYLIIAHNPHLDAKGKVKFTRMYPQTASILYLTVLLRLIELAATQFPYYYSERKLTESESFWFIDKIFESSIYYSNVRAYCESALQSDFTSAEKAVLGFWNISALENTFGGTPISISETVRIVNFLKVMTKEQYETHVFDTTNVAFYEWQKKVWTIGTKFGWKDSEFTLVFIEKGNLFIVFKKMEGVIFKTNSGFILREQWSELMHRLQESTKFAVWYYDFLFNYLLSFTITLVTGGLSALAREVVEEIVLKIADDYIDPTTGIAAQVVLGGLPSASARGLPTARADLAAVVPDGVSTLDRGILSGDMPISRVRKIDSPRVPTFEPPKQRLIETIELQRLPSTHIARLEQGSRIDDFSTGRMADDGVIGDRATKDKGVQDRSSAVDSDTARRIPQDTAKIEVAAPAKGDRISPVDETFSEVVADASKLDTPSITTADRGLAEGVAAGSPSQTVLPVRSTDPDVLTAENLSARSDEFIDAHPHLPVMIFRLDRQMMASLNDANFLRFNIQWPQSSGVPMRVSPDKPLTGPTPRLPTDNRDRKRAKKYMDKLGISREGRSAMHTIDGIINPFVDGTTITGTTFYFGNEAVNRAFGNQAKNEIKRLGLKAGDQFVVRFVGFPDFTEVRPVAPPASPPNLGGRR